MATSDEIFRMILQVEGQTELARLNAELDKEREHLLQLMEIQKAGIVHVNIADIEAAAGRMVTLNAEIKALGGTGGRGGGGILAASYAFQDFTSQIQNGFLPALSSIQNNIPGILMGMGVGGGMIGVISALTVTAGLGAAALKSWWSAAGDSESQKKAEDALTAFEAHIKKINDEFKKLAEAATDPQKESAALIKEFVEQPGYAQSFKRDLTKAFARQGDTSLLSEKERDQLESQAKIAAQTDAQVEAEATMQAGDIRNTVLGKTKASLKAELVNQRTGAQMDVEGLKRKAAERRAEQLVNQMTEGGPNSQKQALNELRSLQGTIPGGVIQPQIMAEIETLTPEAVERQHDEERASEKETADLHEAGQRRKADRQMSSKIHAAELADAAHVRHLEAAEKTKAAAAQKAAMVKQKKLDKIIADRQPARALQQRVFQQTGRRMSLEDAMRLHKEMTNEGRRDRNDDLEMTEGARHRNAAEARKAQHQFQGVEGIRQMGNMAGIEGNEADIHNLEMGRQAKLAAMEARSMGKVLQQSEITQRRISFWEAFEQHFDNRTQAGFGN